jgi:hypothetical protein
LAVEVGAVDLEDSNHCTSRTRVGEIQSKFYEIGCVNNPHALTHDVLLIHLLLVVVVFKSSFKYFQTAGFVLFSRDDFSA